MAKRRGTSKSEGKGGAKDMVGILKTFKPHTLKPYTPSLHPRCICISARFLRAAA